MMQLTSYASPAILGVAATSPKMAPSERASTPMIWQGLCPPLGTVDASPVGSTDGTRGSWLKKDERVGGRQEADEEEVAILHRPFFFFFKIAVS